MPLGAGFAPAGFAPAGYGQPDPAATPVNAILPDALTGLPQPGRLIDPTTGSYQFTSDGRLIGVSRAQQLVQLAVRTLLNSSALSSLGVDFSKLKEQGPNFQAQVTNIVTNAFAPIVNQEIVALVAVTATQYPNIPDRVTILIKWRDLSQGPFAQVQTTQIG